MRAALQPKLGRDGTPMIGPNGRPMHHLLNPSDMRGKLAVWRYLILRRISQITILVLFFGTLHWGWSVAGQPVLAGNLSGSELLGIVPMADPFAVLQILLTGVLPKTEILIGALVIVALYGLIAGRAFCAWVCPLNMVTDLASWLRRRSSLKNALQLPRSTRYIVLTAALVLSALTGVAAFEWVSPISMLHRELIYGVGMGWMAVLGVFMLDLFVVKHGWCGHLCPLGAFYALLGRRTAQLTVRLDADSCTHCAECASVCPEPQVLNLKQATQTGAVKAGECTNCGRCVPLCPEGSLAFTWRWQRHGQPSIRSPENSAHRRTPL